ncbi:MAG: hypothetical protein RLZ97_1191 [Verrucomicrobiota bacterium]|jgi:L-serine dehydratase
MISALELFSIGIGPSSSHTVGPMRAAADFMHRVVAPLPADQVARVRCDLYGSLAATGKGHGTDRAILLGWLGEDPETIDPSRVDSLLASLTAGLPLPCGRRISCSSGDDLDFKRLKPLPLHPNGMHFMALDASEAVLAEEIYYSTGGGFIVTEAKLSSGMTGETSVAHPFASARDLLELCRSTGSPISRIVLENESSFRPEAETRNRLDRIWQVMQECVAAGCMAEGTLPGGLKVRRRARAIHEKLKSHSEAALSDPLTILDWVNLYALAVNEENAAGGRVVTAPTNGAAGIIPAVLHYATRFRHSPHPDGVHRFLLTAAAIGMLYKRNASISGAEAGCQGEVGVACSMAAAGLAEYLGATPDQCENAAEVGMEHNLGLTCDPVGGLVQIPCIERNAMGAVKAINAARLAMSGDGSHFVSLDKVIKTMRDTGRDMKTKYKETSRGGLAVNVVEC